MSVEVPVLLTVVAKLHVRSRRNRDADVGDTGRGNAVAAFSVPGEVCSLPMAGQRRLNLADRVHIGMEQYAGMVEACKCVEVSIVL